MVESVLGWYCEGVKSNSDPRRGESGNSVQIDFKESHGRRFTASIFKHSVLWGKVSWYTIPSTQGSIIIFKILLGVHAISSKKIGSRNRLAIVALGPKEDSGLVLVVQIVQKSFGLFATSSPGCGCLGSLWLYR